MIEFGSQWEITLCRRRFYKMCKIYTEDNGLK